MAPICLGRDVALCFELSSTVFLGQWRWILCARPIVTLSDSFNLCQAVKSDKGTGIGQAAPNRDSNAETSLLWSTGSDICVCLNSHDARRCFDEGLGPLSFVACGNERTPPRVRDFRIQHRCEDNLADALRASANSQGGNWRYDQQNRYVEDLVRALVESSGERRV